MRVERAAKRKRMAASRTPHSSSGQPRAPAPAGSPAKPPAGSAAKPSALDMAAVKVQMEDTYTFNVPKNTRAPMFVPADTQSADSDSDDDFDETLAGMALPPVAPKLKHSFTADQDA
eukprot:m.99335 g.99335  ORF g.99335 m.99335 type:complete len:117 (+) comp8716_c0_seq7:1139-1489(+)